MTKVTLMGDKAKVALLADEAMAKDVLSTVESMKNVALLADIGMAKIKSWTRDNGQGCVSDI